MKLTILLFLFSTLSYGQILNSELLKKYQNYDSIGTYSKEFSTKLIEGSGTIFDKNHFEVGSIGFSTEITKNSLGKLIKIKKHQSNHYEKTSQQIAKTEITEITIYFNEQENPELSKYISEIQIQQKLVRKKINYYNLTYISTPNNEILEIEKLIKEQTDK